MEIKVTIFTPTYNRANTLPRLYESLHMQTNKDFEWLVINDGSTDETDALFYQWLQKEKTFPIHYYKVKNGGKNRAVNQGVQMAKGEYFFIVDSDDFLLPNAVSCVLNCFNSLGNSNDNFIGISTIRIGLDGQPINGKPLINEKIEYVDCNNLERGKYNLKADMAEVFFTEKLKLYPFPIYEKEKFTPEAVIWDRMALDGYKLRWFNKMIYVCDYQQGGLSDNTWQLLRDNPMGYAMLFNVRLEYITDIKMIINYTLQYISCCLLANEKKQIFKCSKILLAIILIPFGWILYLRRKKQIKLKTV